MSELKREDLIAIVGKTTVPAALKSMAILAITTAPAKQIQEVSELFVELQRDPTRARELVTGMASRWGLPADLVEKFSAALAAKETPKP